MKPITFDELHCLAANVDYLLPNTFPIKFKVDGVKYLIGVGYFETDGAEGADVDFIDFFYGYENEIQYLSRIENSYEETILDASDSNGLVFEEIGDILKKCCNITEKSKIELYERGCFNGCVRGVYWADLSDDVIEKQQKLIKEVEIWSISEK
jgi:hypothetical protein